MACDGTLFCAMLQGSSVPGHAARALWNLTSKNPANQDATREAGAVPHLVAMLKDEPAKVGHHYFEWHKWHNLSTTLSFCCFALLATVRHAACNGRLGEVVVAL